MALHNTQCPHCFTTYVISDEQLRVSGGMVRCGSCRELFQARLIKGQVEAPRFDPREAFIEPLTDELDEQKRTASEMLADTLPREFSFADPHTETEHEAASNDAISRAEASLDQILNIDAEQPPQTSTRAGALSTREALANVHARRQAELEQSSGIDKVKSQQPSIDSHSVNTARDNTLDADKEALIDEVDALVDNKLISLPNSTLDDTQIITSEAKPDQPFELDQKPTVKSRAWLFVPILLVIVMALGTTLTYQLWMKQIVVFKDNSFTQEKIIELSRPIVKKLAEHDVVLPIRRNLSQLEIASARTEGHPTRASTTLLRISVINHGEFEQPLPWLEMSLTDADGRLVSRRKLWPRDYVYQNATNNLIGARELKKVTIELLSFPKQATGYELKILNK